MGVGEAVDDAIDRIAGMPPDGEISEFTAEGATLVVEERGAGDRVFVLVHGIGMGRKVFGDLTRLLEPHGRVIAVDLPGYGDAPEPPRTPTIERMADLVAALLRDRGLPPVMLIGHSMGSQVALEIAVRHPPLVRRLVLVAPTVDDERRRGLVQLWRLMLDLVGESPTVLLLGAREYVRAGPHLRRKLHAMLVHRPEDVAPRVAVPTLVVRGEHDIVSPPAWCRRLAALIPGARFAELPDRWHETLLRDAEPAAEAIAEFVAETRPGSPQGVGDAEGSAGITSTVTTPSARV